MALVVSPEGIDHGKARPKADAVDEGIDLVQSRPKAEDARLMTSGRDKSSRGEIW